MCIVSTLPKHIRQQNLFYLHTFTRMSYSSFTSVCQLQDTVKSAKDCCCVRLFNSKSFVEKTFELVCKDLIAHFEETLNSLEVVATRKIQSYKIGQSHVRPNTRNKFSAVRPGTWDWMAVHARWNQSYRKQGYHGLVIAGRNIKPFFSTYLFK